MKSVVIAYGNSNSAVNSLNANCTFTVTNRFPFVFTLKDKVLLFEKFIRQFFIKQTAVQVYSLIFRQSDRSDSCLLSLPKQLIFA